MHGGIGAGVEITYECTGGGDSVSVPCLIAPRSVRPYLSLCVHELQEVFGEVRCALFLVVPSNGACDDVGRYDSSVLVARVLVVFVDDFG